MDFDLHNFKITGKPKYKKLSEDFLNFDYLLRDNQGIWELVKNDWSIAFKISFKK